MNLVLKNNITAQNLVNSNITMGEESVSEDRNHPQLLRIFIHK